MSDLDPHGGPDKCSVCGERIPYGEEHLELAACRATVVLDDNGVVDRRDQQVGLRIHVGCASDSTLFSTRQYLDWVDGAITE